LLGVKWIGMRLSTQLHLIPKLRVHVQCIYVSCGRVHCFILGGKSKVKKIISGLYKNGYYWLMHMLCDKEILNFTLCVAAYVVFAAKGLIRP